MLKEDTANHYHDIGPCLAVRLQVKDGCPASVIHKLSKSQEYLQAKMPPSKSSRTTKPTIDCTRSKRRASALDPETLYNIKFDDNIAYRLFNQIQSSLRGECIDIRKFTLDQFRFLFPRQNHDEQTLECYDRWITEPMFVLDTDLALMISLSPSDTSSPLLEKAAAIYFRSYTITCNELQILLQYWASEGH